MPFISLIVMLVVIGLILWLINTFIPIAQPIKTVINVLIVLGLCLWLLNIFGLTGYTLPLRR